MKKIYSLLLTAALCLLSLASLAQTQKANSELKPYEELDLTGYKTGSDLVFSNNKTRVSHNGSGYTDFGTNKYCGEIRVPDGVTTLYKNGSTGCFQCSYITSITLPSSITTIGQASFADCPYLNYIEVKESETCDFFDVNGVLYKKNKSNGAYDGTYTLVNVPGARKKITILDGTTRIENCAFDGCLKITKVEIPATVTQIGYWAFAGSGIEEMTCLNPTPPDVEAEIDWGFYVKGHGFDDMNNKGNITVKIPAGSTGAYEKHNDWGNRFTYEELPEVTTSETTFIANISHIREKDELGQSVTIAEIRVKGSKDEEIVALPTEGWTLVYEDGTVYELGKEMIVDWYTANEVIRITFTKEINASGEYTLNIPAGSLKTTDGKECIAAKGVWIIQELVEMQTLTHYIELDIIDNSDTEHSWSYMDSDGNVVFKKEEHTIGDLLYTEETRDKSGNTTTITTHYYESSGAHYTRYFKNDQWQALYIPFEMEYSNWSEFFEVASIDNVIENGTSNEIQFYVTGTILGEGDKVEANKPYFIRALTASQTTPKVLEIAKGSVISATDTNTAPTVITAGSGTTYTFTGQYAKSNIKKDLRTFAMASGALRQPNNADTGIALGAFRWYLKIDTPNQNALFSFGNINHEGTTTIDEIEVGFEVVEDNIYYDLSGRPVEDPDKGIYIRNGKKVYVK